MPDASALPPAVLEIPPLTYLAELRASTINAERRTVEIVFYAGASIERFDWASGERYVLSMAVTPEAVRLTRLNRGAPFLNAHASETLGDVIGVIEPGSARLSEGRGIATVRLSRRADVEPIWQDIQDGILRNVSVGAKIHAFQQTEAHGALPMQRLATDWEPFEISAVPVGADPNAQIRAAATPGIHESLPRDLRQREGACNA